MIAQPRDVHPHERYAEQKKNRFGDERFEQLADRRHRDADEYQRSNRAGALGAEPRQSPQWSGNAPLQKDRHRALEWSEADEIGFVGKTETALWGATMLQSPRGTK